jgi:hypothetical protein
LPSRSRSRSNIPASVSPDELMTIDLGALASLRERIDRMAVFL